MLEFFLEGIGGGVVEYSYIPFRDESFRGLVRADASNGSPIDFKLSGHQCDYNASACVGKLFGRIDEFARTGKFEDHGFIIWG